MPLDAIAPREADKLNDIWSRVSTEREQIIERLPHDSALYWALKYHRNTRNERMRFRNSYALLDLYLNIDKMPVFCARKAVQFGVSDLLIIQSHMEAGERGLTVMYVLPKYKLRDRFVNNRIYKLHKKVPYYVQLLSEAHANVHRTSMMHFGQGTLVYVGSNVEDEFIEIPVDSAYVDELDKCNQDNLLYLPDRISASPYKYMREIGNPTVEGYGISLKFAESSQGTWLVKDSAVKYPNDPWFEMDFFTHVMREVDDGKFEVRDPEFEMGEFRRVKVYGPSGKPVDRLQRGQWVHRYPKQIRKGVEISKLFAPTPDPSRNDLINDLASEWVRIEGNKRKEQVFINSNLGKPYEAEGSKITAGMLNAVRVNYPFPPKRVEASVPRYMGVDVGERLHVVMREPTVIDGQRRLKLILAVSVPGFSQLARLIREWKPKTCVVDAAPELHKVRELKADFSRVYSARFLEDRMEITESKDRELRMDRTAVLDAVMSGFSDKYLVLPMSADTIDSGDYYRHLTCDVRLLLVNEENPDKSRYVWTRHGEDHYFLAEGYAMMASMLHPEQDIWAFYARNQKSAENVNARNVPKGPDTETLGQRKDVVRKAGITQESFLDSLAKAHGEEKKVEPEVNDDYIQDVAETMLESRSFVDVSLVARMAEVHEDDVKRVLHKRLGLTESRVRGQWVK